MPSLLEQLKLSGANRVPLDDIKRHFYGQYPEVQNSPERAALLLQELRRLAADGHIALPAAGSWERTGSPALPKFVVIVRQVVVKELEDFARVPWVPELGFWTELKLVQLPALKCINTFLLARRGAFIRVPIKERSLEIFGDEKRLDAMRAGDTLFGGLLPLDAIGAFPVPAPLPYRQADAPGRLVLVVENHNTYWSFGEWNHNVRRYSAVVYGAGEAFRRTGAALAQVLREVGGTGAEYLGDLDPKGLRIPRDFNRAAAPGEPHVAPALEWYAWLLENGRRRDKAECAEAEASCATGWLGEELGLKLAALWATGKWIPQEALGYEQLERDCTASSG